MALYLNYDLIEINYNTDCFYMSITISKDEILAFQTNGAICLRNVFEDKWLSLLSKGIETNLASPGPYSESLYDENNSVFFNDYCQWQHIPEFKLFIYDSIAKDIAKVLMQTKRIGFYHEHILIKTPNNKKLTPWHHDQPYYPIEGNDLCSIWLPLDPVPLEASLRFIKGSHLWNGLFIPRKFETHRHYDFDKTLHQEYKTMPDIDAQPELYDILSWHLSPGDCVVFHGKTLHSAKGNSQKHISRRVFSTRWVGDDATFCLRPWDISPPITGGLKQGEPFEADIFPSLSSD